MKELLEYVKEKVSNLTVGDKTATVSKMFNSMSGNLIWFDVTIGSQYYRIAGDQEHLKVVIYKVNEACLDNCLMDKLWSFNILSI